MDDYLSYVYVDPDFAPPGSLHYNRTSAIAAHVDSAFAIHQSHGLTTFIACFEPTYPASVALKLNLTLDGDLGIFLAGK